jgi:hypothetical protein
VVNINQKNADLIMRGIEDFDYRSEQYYMLVDPSNDMLATTTFGASTALGLRVWSCRRAAEFDVMSTRTLILRGDGLGSSGGAKP